jgi:hypothetical protein
MKEQKHTPEPWLIGAYNGRYEIVGEPESGEMIVRTIERRKDVGGLEVELANARRIVACVNACAGITSEELEWIARSGGMLGPRADIERIAKQRDQLLAALKSLRDGSRIDSAGNTNDDSLDDIRQHGSVNLWADERLRGQARAVAAAIASVEVPNG